MADNEFKYWAFLSYSHQDNREQRADTEAVSHRCWGNWLHDTLPAFSIPAEFIGQINGRGEIIPERIGPVFREELELAEHTTLSAETRQALEQSTCLIVICSPRSAPSASVNEAVRYFKQLGRGQNILPVVVAGEPNASEGNPPERSPENECFVPALRHPVLPDGTLDLTRRAGKSIFVDARHGVEKREILAQDNRTAEADLEMAKIQLIALLIGVGFNGLWWREQKRHFFDFTAAQQQARAALNQVEEVQRQLQEAQRQTRAAQSQALEKQNLPSDVHGQIQAAQDQALAAQNQARDAHQQLQEFQNKVRDTQTQLEEVRHRALAAESKVLEAQQQAREIQNQLEATRQQARDAQDKVLEIQNLSPAVPDPLQDAQNQILKVQSEAQHAHSQLAETQQQAQAASDKFLEAQRQIQEFQSQLEAARNEVREAQSQVLESQQQAREAQRKLQEIQSQADAAQSRVEETHKDVRAVQSQLSEAQNQVCLTQTQVQEIQNKHRSARRLTKVLAVLAVLALLAAGVVARKASQQRELANQALTKAAAEAAGTFELPPGQSNQESIRLVLQKIGGAEQAENRRHSLDQLAATLSPADFPEALAASALVLDDGQRRHFQETLLGDWRQTNWLAAFDWSCQLTNAEFRQRALEKIIPALPTDSFTNTLTRLNELQPVPDERIYTLLFQRWAAQDPAAASQSSPLLLDRDLADKILCASLTVWVAQQPAAAVAWVKAQPDSTAKTKALETCVRELAKTDVPQAIALAESLPEGIWRRAVISAIAGETVPPAEFNRLEWLPENLAPWPWPTWLLNTNEVSPTVVPAATEPAATTTNRPLEIPPKE